CSSTGRSPASNQDQPAATDGSRQPPRTAPRKDNAMANELLETELTEMDDVVRFAEGRATAVRTFVGMARKADTFEDWQTFMSTAWMIARGR
ncbi:MAG: hypothetical protein AB7O86_13995, partial [Porticoccaceae bacterium]